MAGPTKKLPSLDSLRDDDLKDMLARQNSIGEAPNYVNAYGTDWVDKINKMLKARSEAAKERTRVSEIDKQNKELIQILTSRPGRSQNILT